MKMILCIVMIIVCMFVWGAIRRLRQMLARQERSGSMQKLPRVDIRRGRVDSVWRNVDSIQVVLDELSLEGQALGLYDKKINTKQKPISMSKVYYAHTGAHVLSHKLVIDDKGESNVYVKLQQRATIALKFESGVFMYGVSICSKDDNFSRKEGCIKALERLDLGFGTLPANAANVIAVDHQKRGNTQDQLAIGVLKNLVTSIEKDMPKYKKRIIEFNKTHPSTVVSMVAKKPRKRSKYILAATGTATIDSMREKSIG